MTGADFLKRLHKEKALLLVEPSETLKGAYVKKSDRFLSSARILLENDRLEEAVSLAYYSMYYSVLSVLFRAGIKCENHTAAGMLLAMVFDKDASDLSKAKKERIETQYYVDAMLTRDEVRGLLMTVETFDGEMFDLVERMTAEDIDGYRQKLDRLLADKGKRK